MSELLDIVKEWPVIVQGALGSALFAFTLWFTQKIFKFVDHQVSSLSAKRRISELNTEKLKVGMNLAKGRDKALFAAPMLYRMSKPFLKGANLVSTWFDVSAVFFHFGYCGLYRQHLLLFKSTKYY